MKRNKKMDNTHQPHQPHQPQYDEETFPTKMEMVRFITKERIHSLLSLIRAKMLDVTNADTFIILNMDNDLQNYTPEIIIKVKTILINKGYEITERENINGIPCGFKINFK